MPALPITVVETQAFIAASKGCLTEEERIDLSRAELNMLANAAKTLTRTYGA
jgi:hypothetical protein